MSDEAAFLRAIQANPADATAKLVYADWLDEHGEAKKAEYVRAIANSGNLPAAERRRPPVVVPEAWRLVFDGWMPVWDEVTMFALGRLQGLFAAFAMCSDHSADISYAFEAHLAVRSAELQALADRRYAPNLPVRLERLDNWEAELRSVLRANLLMELGHLHGTNHQLALHVEYGRDGIVNAAMDYVRGVIAPTAGWRVHITENQWYAIAWSDLILEASDRVLFLHFSFSD